jgi:hypothetical protein
MRLVSTLKLVYHIIQGHTCCNCDITKSYRSRWYRKDRNGNSELFLCNSCQQNLVYHPIHNLQTNPKRIAFKGKQILLDEPPRKGQCCLCGVKVGQFCAKTGKYCDRTYMHHIVYDPAHPAANTIEVCPSCHIEEHRKLRALAVVSEGGGGP